MKPGAKSRLAGEVGTGPARLVDTQIAAAFAGAGNQSLLTLCKRHLGVTLDVATKATMRDAFALALRRVGLTVTAKKAQPKSGDADANG